MDESHDIEEKKDVDAGEVTENTETTTDADEPEEVAPE
jgi:hypothetical protein